MTQTTCDLARSTRPPLLLLASLSALLLVPDSAVAQPAEPPPEEAPSEEAPPEEAPPEPPEEEKPVALPPPSAAPVKVSYDKGVIFESEDDEYELKLMLRTQIRAETKRSLADGAEVTTTFSVPRARMQLEGHAFGKDTKYKLEFGFGDAGSFSFIKDVFIERALANKLWLRVGQWKRPYNRQELVSDFASQFNERAITSEFTGGGRDIGVALHNEYDKSPEGLEWQLGVFNGFFGGVDRPKVTTTCTQDEAMKITCTVNNPTTAPPEGDFGPTVAARVGWNVGKIKGYSESDLEGGPMRLAIGLGYRIDLADLSKGAAESLGDNLSHGLQIDAMLKVEGFSVIAGGYLMKLKTDDARFGALAQAGYFVMPKKAEVAARFAYSDQIKDIKEKIEARGAFNWYWSGHNLKLATDAGIVKNIGPDKPELVFRSMLQLSF